MVVKQLLLLKSPARFRQEAEAGERAGMARSLGLPSLVMLGLGLVVGAGIFSVPGLAAARYAGPGIIYSFLIAGALCLVAGLCYAELAGLVPGAGSAYAYTYAALGELPAWIVGWSLCLEYGMGAVLVSVAWSGYLASLLQETLGLVLPDALRLLTCGPLETVRLSTGEAARGIWNLPATLLPALLTAVLARSTRGGARLNNAIVAVKLLVILVFVGLGLGLVTRENLTADPSAPGLLALVPARAWVEGAARYGWGAGGVATAVGVVFLAYIGFDAVSTAALEAKRPRRDVPWGILATIALSTVLYVLVALVLTGTVPWRDLGREPLAQGIDHIIRQRGWTPQAGAALATFVKAGALAGLTSGVLVTLLGQARILFALGRDGLLPWFGTVDPGTGGPRTATLVTGACVALAAGILPLALLSELVSIGTLLAFALVCVAVPVLRRSRPDAERPFRVPAPWVLGPLGALTALVLMAHLPLGTWIRLAVWLYAGFCLYFLHGRRGSRLQLESGFAYGSPWSDLFSLAIHVSSVFALAWGATHGWHPLMLLFEGLLALWTAYALVTNGAPGGKPQANL